MALLCYHLASVYKKEIKRKKIYERKEKVPSVFG